MLGEDANTSWVGAGEGILMSQGEGAGLAGTFLGHKFSSLQTVICPLQFSSTKIMSWPTLQIPDSSIAVETYRDEGGGCVEGAGTDIVNSCLLFVQNFLIEYKNR